jgi:hypothetical protein
MSRCKSLVATAGLLIGLLADGACSSPSSPTSRTALSMVRFRAEPSSFVVFSSLDTAQNFVVRDRDAWVRTWASLYARVNALPPPLPDVDFSREMVVVAALGSQPSSGFEVVFTSASEADGVVTMELETRTPGTRCVTLTVITAPVDLARVPRRDGQVVFRPTPTVVNCP